MIMRMAEERKRKKKRTRKKSEKKITKEKLKYITREKKTYYIFMNVFLLLKIVEFVVISNCRSDVHT